MLDWLPYKTTVNHLIFVAVKFRDFSVLDFSLQDIFADFESWKNKTNPVCKKTTFNPVSNHFSTSFHRHVSTADSKVTAVHSIAVYRCNGPTIQCEYSRPTVLVSNNIFTAE